ncbi:MAG: tRNA (adenosine(37)-N6)-dimethylallyltransferase MiaA [Clostridia bacterium]|nr:tRNA (adenosine(37)-N6)-dimethylallyltransferase MiaA [Erysipelotrichia bacterium]NCC87393.1 tRNA (adenosine(37)-N6)-dimethylallyltransferase MiaA [Clostridia bacterium]
MNKIPVIAVVGPTASGKTALAVELAKIYDAEVVSCDSMQVYEGMDIATAKPSADEIQGVPHHLISAISRDCNFSVAMYKELASKIISDINQRGKRVILVGGTGLYAQALLDNLEFFDVPKNDDIRQNLLKRAEQQGTQSMLDELEKIDPETAKNTHPNNQKRIIRALEVYYTSGQTMSQQVENSRLNPSPYDACMIGLDFKDRQNLYDKINKRVDIMLENGLLDETKQYMKEEHSSTANQAIGCKECVQYLKGNVTLEQATEKLKMETRRYAKRQLTWFRKDKRVNWLFIDELDFSHILNQACKVIDESKIFGG